MFHIVRPSTENQMESPEAPKAVQGIFCSSEACSERAVADFDARRLCMEHFLVVCFQELEARNERLKSHPAGTETESLRKFLSESVEQVQKLSECDRFSDSETKSQLLEFLLRASQLSKGLRRSPRLSSSVPVWLRREIPAGRGRKKPGRLLLASTAPGSCAVTRWKRAGPWCFAVEIKEAARKHALFTAGTMETAGGKSESSFSIAMISGTKRNN